MLTPEQNTTPEDHDANKKEPHDPVEAGKKAIEAERLTKAADTPGQKEKDEKDAERWRSEG